MRGRRSRLTPELTTAICDLVAQAVPLKHAAASQGIAESVIHEWLTKGREGKRGYVCLARAVERARGEAVCRLHVAALKKDSSKGAIFLLERLFPNDYGPNVIPLEFRGPLEIVQRRRDPVKVPVDDGGRAVSQN